MAVAITGNGSVSQRVGHLSGWLNDLNSARNGTATTNVASGAQSLTRYNQFSTDLAYSPVLLRLLDGYYATLVTSLGGSVGSVVSQLQSLAQSELIAQVNLDTPLSSQTLSAALSVLLAQMSGNYYFATSSAAAGSQTAATGASNVGNPVIVSSMKDGKGLSLEYVLPETITFACTQDYNGGATKNNEPMSLVGQAAAPSTLDPTWPLGSGVTGALNIIDPTQNNSAGNVLQNSSFDTQTTTNVADNWTIATGSAGTTVLSGGGTANTYTGIGNSIEIVGNGSELTSLTQAFNTTPSVSPGAGGTSYQPLERTPYAFSIWYKMSSSSTAAGVIRFSLVDGSGTIIADDAGTDNTVSVTLSAISDTDWHNTTAAWRLPTAIPSTIKLRIDLTTALTNTKGVYLDQGALSPMSQFYTGGPFFSVFTGSTPVSFADAWTVAITTSMASTTWQGVFERLFGLRALGLRVPISGGSAVNPNLIA